MQNQTTSESTTNESATILNKTSEMDEIFTDWTPESMLEVVLENPEEDFLKIKETLTRIGIESKREKKLFQSCNILHKRGKYYIVHFKELFLLDRRASNFTVADLYRRNTIANLLEEWGLCKVIDQNHMKNNKFDSLRQIKIIPHAQKNQYELVSKYSIGHKKNHQK